MVRDLSTMLKETCTGSTVFFWKSTFTLLDTTYLKRQQRCYKEHVHAYICEVIA